MSDHNKKDFFAYSVPYSGTGAESIKDKYAPSGEVVGGTIKQSDSSRLAVAYNPTCSNGRLGGGYVAPPTMSQDPGSQGRQLSTLAPSVPAHHTYYQTYQDPASLHPGVQGVYYCPTTQFTPSAGAPFYQIPPARFHPTAQFPSSFVGMPGSTAGTRIIRGGGSAGYTSRDGSHGHRSPAGLAPSAPVPGSPGSAGQIPSAPAPSSVYTANSTLPLSSIKRNSASLDLTALLSGLGAPRLSPDPASKIPPINRRSWLHRHLSKTDDMLPGCAHKLARRDERSTEENQDVVENKDHRSVNRKELTETDSNVSTSAKEPAKAKLSPRRHSLQRYSESVAQEKPQELLSKASPSTAKSSPGSLPEMKKVDKRKVAKTDTTWDRTPTKAELEKTDKEETDEDDDYEHIHLEDFSGRMPAADDDSRWTLVYAEDKDVQG